MYTVYTTYLRDTWTLLTQVAVLTWAARTHFGWSGGLKKNWIILVSILSCHCLQSSLGFRADGHGPQGHAPRIRMQGIIFRFPKWKRCGNWLPQSKETPNPGLKNIHILPPKSTSIFLILFVRSCQLSNLTFRILSSCFKSSTPASI